MHWSASSSLAFLSASVLQFVTLIARRGEIEGGNQIPKPFIKYNNANMEKFIQVSFMTNDFHL